MASWTSRRRVEKGSGIFFLLVIFFLLDGVRVHARAENVASVSDNGWTVMVDVDSSVLTVTQDRVATVISNVQLNLKQGGKMVRLKNWSVEKQGQSGLSVITSQPRTAWLIDLGPDMLRISSTSTDGVVTAQAPASIDRMVARLMDPQGFPVTWVGTNAGSSWGASETRNPSFLPNRNPECMYFALGQVSSLNLHSLFDRKSDTAIDFPDQSSIRRNGRDQDQLDVTLPVPGNAAIRILPDYFTKVLGAPFYVPINDANFPIAPMVWGSWSSYYDDVTEQDIVRNTDWIAQNLKAYGLDYVLLDDGYDRGEKGEHKLGQPSPFQVEGIRCILFGCNQSSPALFAERSDSTTQGNLRLRRASRGKPT